jgi:hypothetical protein
MDLFLLLIVGFIGYIIGWHHHAYSTIRRMIDNPQMFVEMLDKIKDINSDSVAKSKEPSTIRTEFLHGQCYIYDGEQFLAQGADLHEALSNAEKRFPGQYNFTLRLTKPNESNQSS